MTRLFVGAVCLTVFVAILAMNGGMLTYTLDDPYIHLSVSEQIWRGQYGVNPGEFSSPSSSVLYPFLLAVGAFSPVVHQYLPLAIGLVSLFATIEILRLFLLRVGFVGDRAREAVAAILVAGVAIAFNLIGLVFTGMEHSLQTALTAASILGLVVFFEEGRAAWWFLTVAALLPLVRYEGLALSLPIAICLAGRGQWKIAIGVVACIAASLGTFSAFLGIHGLPLLPSSVLVKSPQAQDASFGNWIGLLSAIPREIINHLGSAPGLLVAGCGALGIAVMWGDWRQHRRRSDGMMALVLSCFSAGQLVLGQFGWWSRYEVYALLGGSMMLAYLLRTFVAGQLAMPATRSRLIIASLATFTVIGLPYVRTLVWSPGAANSIYQQQYMVHRFITEKLKAPVAVNDLGWSSFQNENYVFDMLGLGSEEARIAKPAGSLEALNPLIRAHGIKVAVRYVGWAAESTPPDWRCVAALRLTHARFSVAASAMEFCATERTYADELRRLLGEFKFYLPPDVILDLYPQTST